MKTGNDALDLGEAYEEDGEVEGDGTAELNTGATNDSRPKNPYGANDVDAAGKKKPFRLNS